MKMDKSLQTTQKYKEMIRYYYKHLFDNNWTTWKKWDGFLEKYNLPKLNQEKIDLDGTITCTK